MLSSKVKHWDTRTEIIQLRCNYKDCKQLSHRGSGGVRMGGREREPQQQSWSSVTHRLNEPGVLPPDALWPRLIDTGRAVISHSSPSLLVWNRLLSWKHASLPRRRRQAAGWTPVTRKSTHPLRDKEECNRVEGYRKLCDHSRLLHWTACEYCWTVQIACIMLWIHWNI